MRIRGDTRGCGMGDTKGYVCVLERVYAIGWGKEGCIRV